MGATKAKSTSTGSSRDKAQPYATEHEAYRFDKIKPPTDPEIKEAYGAEQSDAVKPPAKGKK